MQLPDIDQFGFYVPFAIGTICLLFGWLLYRVILVLAGGILGGAIGVGVGQLFAELFDAQGTSEIVLVAGLAVLGIIVGVLLFQFLHALAFFLSGAAIGSWGTIEIFRLLREHQVAFAQNDLIFAFSIPVVALVLGLLAVPLSKYVIAFASAAAGTFLIMGALGWPYGGWLAIPVFLFGLVIQLAFGRPWERRDEDED
ncbi:hypothetical protein KQI84_15945 [bacterium]|nr:hypothetical protein [bacterium]